MPETTPRYVPAEKAYLTADGETGGPHWGVLDNETGLFAPFGGDALLAAYATEAVTAKPDLGWEFVPVLTPANS
ncbi:hypothetical protein PQE18_gp53 [Arthrobacter phage DrSierra]|uniref:Uncharacterized protein n=1 Tax=Arthrobacter phage DrSierra TaxID=2704034 RepID=A0A6G6XK92_9CAUD|nr:hypothetical protein PQE18_gp53 [Arthrobacter phage DrSierra]QIG58531.1 hypothetical protein SEA_DRSIERRA_53 [Arthrobacter phage DrSierra]